MEEYRVFSAEFVNRYVDRQTACLGVSGCVAFNLDYYEGSSEKSKKAILTQDIQLREPVPSIKVLLRKGRIFILPDDFVRESLERRQELLQLPFRHGAGLQVGAEADVDGAVFRVR